MKPVAQCAAAIKSELKANFPTVKFSVRSESFSGGNAVDISWIDGPTDEQVREITDKYQYGHFDGMIDCYEYSNRRTDIPQAKYVQTARRYSAESKAQAAAILGIDVATQMNDWHSHSNSYNYERINSLLWETDFTASGIDELTVEQVDENAGIIAAAVVAENESEIETQAVKVISMFPEQKILTDEMQQALAIGASFARTQLSAATAINALTDVRSIGNYFITPDEITIIEQAMKVLIEIQAKSDASQAIKYFKNECL